MEIETVYLDRYRGPLIHYYFMAPAPQFRADHAIDRRLSSLPQTHKPDVEPRLSLRWTRQSNGTLGACWQAS
jgi:hypothetical protein